LFLGDFSIVPDQGSGIKSKSCGADRIFSNFGQYFHYPGPKIYPLLLQFPILLFIFHPTQIY